MAKYEARNIAEKSRMSIYIRQSSIDRVGRLAEKMGRTKTFVAVLAIEAGMDLLELSTSKDFAGLVAKNPELIGELQRMALEAKENE